MALVEITEVWELTHALCIAKRGLVDCSITPIPNGVTISQTSEFLVFSEPLFGEFTLRGNFEETLLHVPDELEATIAQFKRLGINNVSGFNDLSFGFSDSKIGESALVSQSPVPNTSNTFFARLVSSVVGEQPTPPTEEIYYNTQTGVNYTTPPLVPLKIVGNTVLPIVWDDVNLLDVVALPTSSPTTLIRCYLRGDELEISSASFTPGNNYYWVNDSFALVAEPLAPTVTKTVWVGTALTQTKLNLVLSLLFED